MWITHLYEAVDSFLNGKFRVRVGFGVWEGAPGGGKCDTEMLRPKTGANTKSDYKLAVCVRCPPARVNCTQ